MSLRRVNQRVFWRRLYAGQLKTVTLLKRGVDQHEGTVVSYTLFRIRRTFIGKRGEALQDDMAAGHRCAWLIPRAELERNGLTDINVLDRIVERPDHPSQANVALRYWEPESDSNVEIKLFEDYVRVEARRVDPPNRETLLGHPDPPLT